MLGELFHCSGNNFLAVVCSVAVSASVCERGFALHSPPPLCCKCKGGVPQRAAVCEEMSLMCPIGEMLCVCVSVCLCVVCVRVCMCMRV